MQLDLAARKTLEWVSARAPVIGMFHVMTELKPMIDRGLIERRRIASSSSQLLITDAGKAALTLLAV